MSKIPLKGALLLASPIINSQIFDHSVVYIARYSPDEGAVGIVLNRPLNKTVDGIGGEESIPEMLRNVRVHIGGPVDVKELSFGAFYKEEDSIKISTHISTKRVTQLMEEEHAIVHAYVGNAAWAPNQLENELNNGFWIVTRPNLSLLRLRHNELLWHQLLKQMSPMHAILSYAPHRPFIN